MQQTGLFDNSDTKAIQGRRRIIFAPNFESFRLAARGALAGQLPPDSIWWVEQKEKVVSDVASTVSVPKAYVQIAQFAACHRAPDRWDLLYQVLWRLTHGEPHLLALSGSPLIAHLQRYDKAVHRDLHKMKAFVRFKRIEDDVGERFVAWFEPEHFIIRLAAKFFRKRFFNMRWSLLTPVGCAHWEGASNKGSEPTFTPGLDEAMKPTDELDELWKTYYRNIFNPARVKLDAMRAEMPQKYWKHLPEAELIPSLVLSADSRVGEMLDAAPLTQRFRCGEPPRAYQSQLSDQMQNSLAAPLERVVAEVKHCQNCDRCELATQAVPGEGPANATVMMVGEQPGDQEDLAGRPFVGPAGQLLDEVLNDAGLDRTRIYMTNAVKHFGFRMKGKRRLHERPGEGHIQACRAWLEQEIAAVEPDLIVCLGVTAASAVLGRRVKLGDVQGRFLQHEGKAVFVTLHPSAVLRANDPHQLKQQLLEDLEQVRKSRDMSVGTTQHPGAL